MYIQLENSGEWLELKNTEEKKWRRSSYLPLPPLPTPAPLAVFSCSFFFAPTLRADAFDPLSIIVKATLFWEFVSLGTIVVKQRVGKMTYIE